MTESLRAMWDVSSSNRKTREMGMCRLIRLSRIRKLERSPGGLRAELEQSPQGRCAGAQRDQKYHRPSTPLYLRVKRDCPTRLYSLPNRRSFGLEWDTMIERRRFKRRWRL